MNWTDNLIPDYYVSIKLCLQTVNIEVTFSRIPDSTVLADLLKLANKPGFRIYNPFKNYSYVLYYPNTFDGNKIKTALIAMLQSHSLTVKY